MIDFLQLALPAWLTDEKYLTLATWGLVIATGMLVVYSYREGREQQKRWEREDKLRFRFGLQVGRNERDLELWCANLGKTSFILQRLFLQKRGEESPKEVAIQEIISVGEMRMMLIEESNFKFFNKIDSDFKAWIGIDGFENSKLSESLWFHLDFYSPPPIAAIGLKIGCWDEQSVDCPECGRHYLYFPKGAAVNEEELAEQVREATLKVKETCPDHAEKEFKFGKGKIVRTGSTS
ncbi:MAG: hypothetical protein ACYC46_08870 [Acidobacteriaceae bacterium]